MPRSYKEGPLAQGLRMGIQESHQAKLLHILAKRPCVSLLNFLCLLFLIFSLGQLLVAGSSTLPVQPAFVCLLWVEGQESSG